MKVEEGRDSVGALNQFNTATLLSVGKSTVAQACIAARGELMTWCGRQAVNAPLKGGQLTTAAAVGNRSIIERVIDQLTAIDRRCLARRAAILDAFFCRGRARLSYR